MQINEWRESQEKLQTQLAEQKIKLDEKSSHMEQLQFKINDLGLENDKLKEAMKKTKATKIMNPKPAAHKKHAFVQTIAASKPLLVDKYVNTTYSDTPYCDKCRGCNPVSKPFEKSMSTLPLHTSHAKLPSLNIEKIEHESNSPNYKESFEESNSFSLNENSTEPSFSFMEVNKFSRIMEKLKKENKKLLSKNKRLERDRKKITKNDRDVGIKKYNFKKIIINNYDGSKSARQEKKNYKTKQIKKLKKSQNTSMENNSSNDNWTIDETDNRLKRKPSLYSCDKPLEKKRKIVTENTTVTKDNIVTKDSNVNENNILNSIIVSDLNLSEDDDTSPNETLNMEVNINSNDQLIKSDSKSVSKAINSKKDINCFKSNRPTMLSKNVFKTQDTSTKIRPIPKNILQSCSIRNDHNLQKLITIKDTKSLNSLTSNDLKSNCIQFNTTKATENVFNNDQTDPKLNNKSLQSNTSPNPVNDNKTSSPLKVINPIENVTKTFSDIQSTSQVTCNLENEVRSDYQGSLNSNDKNTTVPYNNAADNQNKVDEDSNPNNLVKGKSKLKQTVIDIFGEDIEDLSDNDNVSKENQTSSKVMSPEKNIDNETKDEKIQGFVGDDSKSSRSSESSEDSSHLSEDSDSSKDSLSSDEEEDEVSYRSNATRNDSTQNIEASCFSNEQNIDKVKDAKFENVSNEPLKKNTEKSVTNKIMSDVEHDSALNFETNCSLSSTDDSNSSIETEPNSSIETEPNSIETKTKKIGLNPKRKKLLFKIRNIKNITKKLPIKTAVPKATLNTLNSSSGSCMSVNDSIVIPTKKRIAHTPKTSPKLVDTSDKNIIASTPKPSNLQTIQDSLKQQIDVKSNKQKIICTISEASKKTLGEDTKTDENKKCFEESIENLSEKKKTEIGSIKTKTTAENKDTKIEQNGSKDISDNSVVLSILKTPETALAKDIPSKGIVTNSKESILDSLENKQSEKDSIISKNTSEISAETTKKFSGSNTESEEDESKFQESIQDQSEDKIIKVEQNELKDIAEKSVVLSNSKVLKTVSKTVSKDTLSKENERNFEESILDSLENEQSEKDSIISINTSEISAEDPKLILDSDTESEEDKPRFQELIQDQLEDKVIKVEQNESKDISKKSVVLSKSKAPETVLAKDTPSKKIEINSKESFSDSLDNEQSENDSIISINISEKSAEAPKLVLDSDTESEKDETYFQESKIKQIEKNKTEIKSKATRTDLNKDIKSKEDEICSKELTEDSLEKRQFKSEPIKSEIISEKSTKLLTSKALTTNLDEICHKESNLDIIKKEPTKQIPSSSMNQNNVSNVHMQSGENKIFSQDSTLKQPKRRKLSNSKNSFKIGEEIKNNFVSKTKKLTENPKTLQESVHGKLEKSMPVDIGNIKLEENLEVSQKCTEDVLNQSVTVIDNDNNDSPSKKTKIIGLKNSIANIKSESPNIDCSPGRELRSRQLISYNEINLYHNNGSENDKSDTPKAKSLEQLKHINRINEENTSLPSSFVLKCLNECLVAPIENLKVQKNNIHHGIVRKQKKFIDEEIFSLMEAEEWNSEINDSVCKNLVKFNDWKMVAFVMIEHAAYKFTDDEALDKTHTPPAPLMTPSEQKLVTLIVSIEKHNPDFGTLVVEALQFKLFRLQPAQEASLVERLFRILIVLCRIKRDREKVRIFLLDALYSLNMRAVNCIYVALTSWSELIPKHDSNNDIFVKTLVHTIMSMNPKRIFPKLMTLKNLLSMYYEYPNSDYDDSKFKEELIEHLLKDTPGASTAILIFCKKMGTEWTIKNIVNRLKIMIVNKVNPSPSVILPLLGNILRTFPTTDKENDVKDIIDQLCDVFEATDDDDLKESIVSCLLSISKFNYNKIMRVIIQWQPKEELSPSLKEKFVATFKKHDLKWWLKFVSTNFPRKKVKKGNYNSKKNTI
ncbi:uncharacterized protein YFR016C-like [Trichogramma pretiosum]|uniref:uncharacterized protein YFR016C-like n=1 Tax=Trichogramma pretiosum TaxID=7493 RepID=UPI0006C9E181|nr:uncharacterized protein YFR016C-like [Trichogramma pretiosum]